MEETLPTALPLKKRGVTDVTSSNEPRLREMEEIPLELLLN